MDGLVLLKPKQAYGGCMGVIMEEVPRGHHRIRMYVIYIDGLGTIVRGENDLQKISDADITDPSFKYITPQYWKAETRALCARKALMQALRNNNHAKALFYANEAAQAEIEMEAI